MDSGWPASAEKRNQLDAVVAQSICRVVVAPFPLPGPSGAIQALGGIDTNGVRRARGHSLPWFDAYDRPYVEYGLDSSVIWEKNKNYAAYAHPQWGLIVRPTNAAIAAQHEYRIVSATGPTGGTEPAWDLTPGNTNNYGGNVTYKEVTPTAYPIGSGAGSPIPATTIATGSCRCSTARSWIRGSTRARRDRWKERIPAGHFRTDGSGNYVRDKAYNDQWDYQDLPFSNNGSGKNEFFDVCLALEKVRRESTNADVDEWLPLPYFPGCNVGNNISTPGCNCSEPFEPYINIHYAGQKDNLQAYWDNPATAASAYAKATNDDKPAGTPVTCNGSSVASKQGQEQCATNAYDRKGALADLAVDADSVIIRRWRPAGTPVPATAARSL
jgi:hypothetical protein